MRIAYPVVITRSQEYPEEATVHFPDFGEVADDVIAWGDKATMLKAAAFSLGTAYAAATCFDDEAPEPSPVKRAATKNKVVDECTCNYDLFCEHCLKVREIPLT